MSEDKKKDRYQIATDYHNRGYNCCQSVCFAFLDQVDLDEKTLFRVTEGLGLGMGGMEGTCGAISAAAVQHRRSGTPQFQGGYLQGRQSLREGVQGPQRHRNLPGVKRPGLSG